MSRGIHYGIQPLHHALSTEISPVSDEIHPNPFWSSTYHHILKDGGVSFYSSSVFTAVQWTHTAAVGCLYLHLFIWGSVGFTSLCGWPRSESSTVWMNRVFSKTPRIKDHQHHIIIIIFIITNSNTHTHSHTAAETVVMLASSHPD